MAAVSFVWCVVLLLTILCLGACVFVYRYGLTMVSAVSKQSLPVLESVFSVGVRTELVLRCYYLWKLAAIHRFSYNPTSTLAVAPS